jgi:hypothetical protein
MPTLLWRVLSFVGYPDGMEPRYFWRNNRLGEGLLVTVEAIVRPRGDGSVIALLGNSELRLATFAT